MRLDALREHLQSTNGDTELHGAGELSGALERLSGGGVDAVILDPDLPDSQGIVTFERMYAFAPDVPVIVLTNNGEDDLAVRAVQGGAQDCMLKDEADPSVLLRSVRYAIERHRLLTALRSLSLIDGLTDLYNRRGFHDTSSLPAAPLGRLPSSSSTSTASRPSTIHLVTTSVIVPCCPWPTRFGIRSAGPTS